VTDQAEQAAVRSQSERAVRNTVSMLASRVAVAVMGWAGTVVIARMLSPDQWGKFSFIFGVLGLMSIVTDLGVGRVVLAKLVDEDEDERSRVATSFILLRLALGLIGYAVAVLFVVLSGYPGQVIAATAVAGIVVVIATPSHALTVLYQSRLRLSYVAAAEMFGQLVQLVFTILAALVAPILIVFVIPAIANEVISIVVKIRGVRKGHVGRTRSSRPEIWRWKEMLVEAVPLSIGFAFVGMASKIDLLMLARLDSFDSVGMYSIGYKFADFVMVAAVAVVTPFTTLMVSAWPRDPDAFRKSIGRAAAIIAVLGAAGVAAFWPAADHLLVLLYGKRFEPAAFSTNLLIAGACLAAMSQLALMILVSVGKHRVYPWVSLGVLLLNVGLNLVLIPRFSYHGAAWATVASEATLLAAACLVVHFSIKMPDLLPLRSVLGPALLAAAVISVSMLVPVIRSLPWPVLTVVNAAVVLIGAHALGLTAGLSLRSLRDRGSVKR
jgi:O-antigen/teichoic acid export membrane protein